MNGKIIVVCGFMALAPSVLGQALDQDQPWQASVELGFIATTGNTETLSFQTHADVTQETERWRNEYEADVLFKDDEFETESGERQAERTAERYFLSAKTGYKLAEEHSNLFLYGSHTHDEFGAYERYSTASVGYSSRWLESPASYLQLEIGPGYFRGERELADGTREVENGAMVRGAAEYRWQFTDSAEFLQQLSVEAAAENTRTLSDTSVSTKISDSLQLKVGYSIYHNTDAPEDKEGTDTTTYINLVYNL